MAKFNKGLIIGVIFLIFSLSISGCGPSPEQETAANTSIPSPTIQIIKTPEGTAAPTTLEILKAMTPSYEVYFDGVECIVEGPSELNTGEYFFILHNQTDPPASLGLGSYFGEGTFDDHLLWREENCGGQGSHCEDDEGQLKTYTYVTRYNPNKVAREGIETYYVVYDITMERQYSIVVYSDGWWSWLCAPIQVSNSP